MVTHSPRAFPWEIEPPVGNHHLKAKPRPKARPRRPRARPCLNKACGRKYQPRRWNQRYCQDPECLRVVNRWQAAQRQAKRREPAAGQAEHAEAERARRHQAKSTPQVAQSPEVTPARGHAAESSFSLPLCKRPGCHEHPVSSIRNLARFCCRTCHQAVRNVLDRERKWLSRGTSDGQKRRTIGYETAQRRRALRQCHIPEPAPPRPPPK
jgi:hypothetical protein